MLVSFRGEENYLKVYSCYVEVEAESATRYNGRGFGFCLWSLFSIFFLFGFSGR
jgi:hypothetical protein